MANNNVYSIGQYISEPKGGYTNVLSDSKNINVQLGLVETLEAVKFNEDQEDDTGIKFADRKIKYEEGFSSNSVYFIRFKIRRHESLDLTYNIKLTKENSGKVDIINYQYLERVTVPRRTYDANEANILVYFHGSNDKDENGNENKVEAIVGTNEYVEVKEGEEKIKYTEPCIIKNDEEKSIGQVKRIYLNYLDDLNGDMNNNEYYETIEILFSPITDANGFDTIYIEKLRDHEDYTETFTENNDEYYGIYFNILDDITLYEVKNLLFSDKIPPKKLSRIGVWGRPNMCMSLNNEEIRIGKAGHYEIELDNIVINNFGIVYEDTRDSFLIDYEYRTNEAVYSGDNNQSQTGNEDTEGSGQKEEPPENTTGGNEGNGGSN